MLEEIIYSPIFWWIAGILIIPGILMWVASYFIAARCIFDSTLRRIDSDTWKRGVPKDASAQSLKMFNDGLEWARKNEEFKRDVHIVNEGLNLYGEYYDLGYDKTVLILSGRTDSLTYGYYFAIPYSKNGCNVLVIDARAHGMSDGKFNTLGFDENRDVIAWIRFLESEFGVKNVIVHALCIGAAGGVYALTSENCPDTVKAFIAEGMFPNFAESMKNHLIEKKKPVRFLMELIDRQIKKNTGYSMKYGPIDVIEKLDVPLLMLHGRKDIYSTPEYAQKLFKLAGSEKKRLSWFDEGTHSMLRVTDPEAYDAEIEKFLCEIFELQRA